MHSSCDLDEWTEDQLDLMKISGNGNAKLFFKKHGVTESQMQSEKKYSTKAAAEYRRSLARLLADASRVRSGSIDAVESPKGAKKESTWESSSGLDNLMKSVSGGGLDELVAKEEPVSTASTTVFEAALQKVENEDNRAPVPVEKKAPVVIGTLSVNVDNSKPVAGLKTDAPLKFGKSLGKKAAGAKKMGARKLTGTIGSSIGMDSFDDVDARAEVVKQEKADHELAVKMHNADLGEDGGSSRLSAIYMDAESIYKPAAKSPVANNSYSTGSSGSSAYGGGRGSTVAPVEHADTSKFTNQKGISSDAYFGRDDERADANKSRLANFQGSAAISSDMINGNMTGARDDYSGSYGVDSADNVLRDIKDSVSGFFDSVQNM